LALLVGVGDYQSPNISKLTGPPNDIARLKSLLTEKFEFPEENIQTLVSAQATRQAILDALCKHLVARARPDDTVVFYYSGHGSRVADRDPKDESDGYDETLVPYDARLSGSADIRDDEVKELLDRLATRNVTVIFDSCHSGTGTRFLQPRGIEPEASEVAMAEAALAQRQPGARSISVSNGFQPDSARYVLITGSRADQLSYEFPFAEGTHGALTYYLTQVMREATPDATFRDVVERAAAQVSAKFPSQTPQLEGANQDNLLFQGISALASPYVQAAPSHGGSVRLAAGAVHGVTAGSTYTVHPPGTRDFTGAPLATVEVTDVRPFEAIAKILNGSVTALASRAVEITHVDPGRRVRVFAERDEDGVVSQALVDTIQQAVAAGRRDVEFVASLPADLIMARLPKPPQPADAPRSREIAFYFPDGSQASAAIAHDNPNRSNELAAQLAQWAHWFGVLNLTNSQARVKAVVTTEVAGGGNVPANTAPSSTQVQGLVVRDGGKFVLRVKNTYTQPLFVHVLGLFPDGSIAALWPPQGSQQHLPAGGEWTDSYDANTNGTDQVRDVLKVILSTNSIDISLLERPGMRAKSAMNPLEQLLTDSAEGGRTVRRSETGDWFTVEKSVTVIR
jgi:hypothetical protein